MKPRRYEYKPHKGYSPYAFTAAEDARILELRAAGLNRAKVGKAMGVAYYAITIRITLLEALTSNPDAKFRLCIRPGCATEFVSDGPGHRVCEGCKSMEVACEPFGNFVVVMA